MHPGSRPRSLVAAALGLMLSVGIALPASAAPASEQLSAVPQVALPDRPMLHAVMTVLDSRSKRVPDSVTSWYVDPATDSVVVTATDDAAARAFTAGAPGVRIEHVNSRPVPTAALHGGDGISSADGDLRCSAGFNAFAGRTRYLITAGHCTQRGGTWSGPDGRTLGRVVDSSYPDNDFGLIQLSPGWTQTGDVGTPDSGYVAVAGTTPARVGDSVCRFGVVSGYQCGRVEAIGVTANYGNGDVVRGLTRTNACSEPGDSGGPFMSGRQAQGVLSGADSDHTCQLGRGKTYFQPIREVLATYGLTLIGGRSSESVDRDQH